MRSSRRTTILALASAGAIIAGGAAFAAAPAAFAAAPPNQNSNITGSVTIVTSPTMTMSLNHTTFSLGSGNTGDAVTDGTTIGGTIANPTVSGEPIDVTVTEAANPTGYQVTFAATSNFTGAAHGATFPAADLNVLDLQNPNQAGPTWNPAAFDWAPVPAPGTGAVQVADNAATNGTTVTPLAFEIANAPSSPPFANEYTGGLPNVTPDAYSMTATVTALAGH